ncbi:MAG: hypothetical protein ACRD03_08260, partial [Acidimicrobiales bacterium]
MRSFSRGWSAWWRRRETPGPGLRCRRHPGGQQRDGRRAVPAQLWTWHEERDLALLVLGKGSVATLPQAGGEPPVRMGERIFAVSGLGSAGGSVSQGFVT